MRRVVSVLASATLAVGLLFSGAYSGISVDLRKAAAQTVPARPNIVFILTDDMRKDDLSYMPQTRALLKGEGMSFENAFVSHALCAPSRATIMRGQYAHNAGVWSNSATDSPSTSTGGWQAYQARGNEADNVATRLDDAGYRTALFGKYMNRYAGTTYVPPGWDRWFAIATSGEPQYFGYDVVSEDQTISHYGTNEADYTTDVLSNEAGEFMRNSALQGQPFFAYVAPIAPHSPATPAPRDEHAYDGVTGPRFSSFDEGIVDDKPSWIRQLPRLTADRVTEIDNRHERRVESLQAVDDLVQNVVLTLDDAGELDNTYIFFTSDNGFHHGEHRIPMQKWRPYEEDVNVPLLVRGPDVAPGSTTYKMALNTDYLPTFTRLAGAQTPAYVDGRSLRPVLRNTVTSWRSAVLLEAAAEYSPPYRGVRTVNAGGVPKRKYVEYSGGEKELYELGSDPRELANRYSSSYPAATALAARLQKLKGCARDTCFTFENGP